MHTVLECLETTWRRRGKGGWIRGWTGIGNLHHIVATSHKCSWAALHLKWYRLFYVHGAAWPSHFRPEIFLWYVRRL